MLWYFDLKDQPEQPPDDEGLSHSVLEGVIYNGTHIQIPMYKQMVAGYSRKYKPYDEEETGIVTAAYLPNEVSVITDKPKAGMTEKYHTLTYSPEDQYSTDRGEYMRAQNEEFMATPTGESFDVHQFAGRLDALSIVWGATGIISGYVEAGIDKAHLWQLRRYAAAVDEGKAKESPSSPVWRHHTDLAKQAIDLAKDSDFMSDRRVKKSENHCKHFEDGTGVSYTDTHVTIPLNTPITTLSGEMVYSPMYYLGLNSGYNVVHYDEENQVLQMFYQVFDQARQYSDVEHQDDNKNPSGLWLSRVAEGDEYEVSEVDGRSDIYLDLVKPEFKLVNAILDALDLDPAYVDSVFARPMADTCLDKYVEGDTWKQLWEEIDLSDEGDEVYKKLLDAVTLVPLVVVSTCGTTSATTRMVSVSTNSASGITCFWRLHKIIRSTLLPQIGGMSGNVTTETLIQLGARKLEELVMSEYMKYILGKHLGWISPTPSVWPCT